MGTISVSRFSTHQCHRLRRHRPRGSVAPWHSCLRHYGLIDGPRLVGYCSIRFTRKRHLHPPAIAATGAAVMMMMMMILSVTLIRCQIGFHSFVTLCGITCHLLVDAWCTQDGSQINALLVRYICSSNFFSLFSYFFFFFFFFFFELVHLIPVIPSIIFFFFLLPNRSCRSFSFTGP